MLAISGMGKIFTFGAVILCCEVHGGEGDILELIQSGDMSVFDMHITYYNGDVLEAELTMCIT